jgi:ribonuclease HII
VIAKVTRDRIMARLHEDYPVYDFLTHKGYVTPSHTTALAEHGPCEIHRRRFVNVRRAEGSGEHLAVEDPAGEGLSSEPVPGHPDDLGGGYVGDNDETMMSQLEVGR